MQLKLIKTKNFKKKKSAEIVQNGFRVSSERAAQPQIDQS